MRWTSIVAIYCLFWVLSAFLVLPFGVRTHDEAGLGKVAGQAESAPANFSPRRIVKRATALAVVLFGLFMERWVYRPIQRHEGAFFTVFIAAFGMQIVVQNLVGTVFGRNFETVSVSLSQAS